MKAVVYHGPGDIRLDTAPDPRMIRPTDAIVRITASAICGTDLHMIRGTMPGMKPGTILGHEGVGVVEEVGPMVRNLARGDRVVIPSTIGCGSCVYCRDGYTAQCDDVNPNGSRSGTAFFGGPAPTGPFDGLQAEYAVIPFANVNLVKLPEGVTDDQAILLSDIYPTGDFGADLAGIGHGHIVAVWGCGPVGLFAIVSAYQRGAARVIAVDGHGDRLERARELGAETVNFNEEDPVELILQLTGGAGPDRAIDAVGVDAERPKEGPAAEDAAARAEEFERQRDAIVNDSGRDGPRWKPGDAPTMAATWAVQSLAKAGTLSIIGVYPETDRFFPIGQAMQRNLTIRMGNCNHLKYVPRLVDLVERGSIEPTRVTSQVEPMSDVIEAYRQFDLRRPGWIKVQLDPAAGGSS